MIRGKIIKKPPVAEVLLKASIHNKFDIEVIDSVSGKVKTKAQAHNTILNSLWAWMGNATSYGYSSWGQYIHYGSGTATPTAADTSLSTFVGGAKVTEVSHSWDGNTGVYKRTCMIALSETTAVGVTLSEVGVASGIDSSTLMTKALLKDMNGNQISLEKTATDIVNIYATIFVHVNPEGYSNGAIKIYSRDSGDEPSFLSMLAGNCLYGAEGYSFPTRVCVPTTGSQMEGNASIVPGPCNEKTLSWTFDVATRTFNSGAVRFAVAEGNAPHGICVIGIILKEYTSDWKYYRVMDIAVAVDSSWYGGSDIVGEAIGTGDGATTEFATKFGFVQNPKVYVDGVEATNVTIDINEPVDPKNSYLGQMKAIDEKGAPHAYVLYGKHENSNKNYRYLENPNWETIGIESFYVYAGVLCSNDFVTWELAGNNTAFVSVPEKYRNYRYWCLQDYGTNTNFVLNKVVSTLTRTNNIHFAEPPASGSVITVDYHTPVIAKDENHVFDFSVSIQLGEYTEAQ